MKQEFSKWFRIALFNLLIVAMLGVILRYKIAYSLPFIDQKNLLQGHSHFAFSGWITQCLMTMLIYYLFRHGMTSALHKYRSILILNLITAFGMLISFPIEGYATVSIIFSTLSIFVSYAFMVMFLKDLRKINKSEASRSWLQAAVILNAISSVGAFSLAFMLATHQLHERWYLSAIYFFLHFQYNGWFFFAIMGMWMDSMAKAGVIMDKQQLIFRLFFYACFPAYFLSVLWLKIPLLVYVMIVLSALAQLYAWILIVRNVWIEKEKLRLSVSLAAGRLFKLSALALTIKLLLQIGSTHPALSQIAFGFRPIVIGYLHLVLLGVITLFLIGWMLAEKGVSMQKGFLAGAVIFTSGIFLNELMLMLQGVFGMQGKMIASGNEMLFYIALILFSGTMLMVGFSRPKEDITAIKI